MRFQFTDENKRDYVPADKLYEPSKDAGHGFLTEVNRNKYERLQIPELNDGFNEVFWYQGEKITNIFSDNTGAYVDYDGQGELPLSFVCNLPKEGNYKVKVKFEAACDIKEAKVFLGRRRLCYLGSIRKGESVETKSLANICPIIARGSDKPTEDLTLDVTLLGRGIHLQEIEISDWGGPTVYIAGDSTVTDQSAAYPYLPWNSYAAWGQMLSFFVGNEFAISNHAHSGLTTESFRAEGHYQILADRVKKGDYVFFQFGHNDQKLMNLKADEGYRDRLEEYINEIKEKGATPVIISPLARNSWKREGETTSYNDLLAEYAKECELIAKEQEVPFIDLHQKAMNLIVSLGRDKAKSYFFPGDYTHTNDYGAYLFASMIFEGLKAAGIVSANQVDVLWQPPEETIDLVIPKEYKNRKNPDAVNLFDNLERPEDFLTRVEAMDFIIKTCKFFPTNVYNDYFEDVIGHEIYAGIVECACQNGMITEEMTKDGRFYPNKPITRGEFKTSLINGYSARMTISDAVLDFLGDELDLDSLIKRREAADICRGLSV